MSIFSWYQEALFIFVISSTQILKLDQVTLQSVTTGQIINLISKNLDRVFVSIHYLWIGPLHLGLYIYLVYQELGWPVFTAVAFIVFQIVLQTSLRKVYEWLGLVVDIPSMQCLLCTTSLSTTSSTRKQRERVTDKRVKKIKEIVYGIRVIKMYVWEYAFQQVVAKLRK